MMSERDVSVMKDEKNQHGNTGFSDTRKKQTGYLVIHIDIDMVMKILKSVIRSKLEYAAGM